MFADAYFSLTSPSLAPYTFQSTYYSIQRSERSMSRLKLCKCLEFLRRLFCCCSDLDCWRLLLHIVLIAGLFANYDYRSVLFLKVLYLQFHTEVWMIQLNWIIFLLDPMDLQMRSYSFKQRRLSSTHLIYLIAWILPRSFVSWYWNSSWPFILLLHLYWVSYASQMCFLAF